ncbi:MAG: phosphoribosylformylglycinamidine synthase [Spirochaetales bacterium]|nr:phosphoribosylformylglycinamidine synthase [Spirochaetales bacterium]
MGFYRVFVEKKVGFDQEAVHLKSDFRETLRVQGLERVRLLNIYEADDLDEGAFKEAVDRVFSEKNVDTVHYDFTVPQDALAVEALPGQFDQRADSAAQCMKLLHPHWEGRVKTGKLLILEGSLSADDRTRVENYFINPLEMRHKDLSVQSIEDIPAHIVAVEAVEKFIEWNEDELETFRSAQGMAMTHGDLAFVQTYFRDQEKRNPTETELKVLDTYWSDHCRHTTFETELTSIDLPSGRYEALFQKAFDEYLAAREKVHGGKKPMTLMDMATLAGKELRRAGKLDDMEVSEEINACSVFIDVDVTEEGKTRTEKWLLMFKNETHNHPTEIEPFGGASTCIGGAIRDPLSGRSYVYQAMRLTGAGDPRVPVEETLEGKLPQKVITTGAARGYSSYGNQIGLATSYVKEIYHPGYRAKRMEVGAVVGAVPADWVRRESPVPGDVIILLGGKTGRDGCGGATGSSKAHTTESLESCGADVQKGNAPEERKIQRLFRNPEVTGLIKKCNDFGAGGVSVAIGELSDGLEIDLDRVPVKYKGLNGTELAISESQERMAVVVDKQDRDRFLELADRENLEAVEVAAVTGDNRLRMTWRGEEIVNIDRTFLDTNGVRSEAQVKVVLDESEISPFVREPEGADGGEKFLNHLASLEVASQKGLVEMFDSTIGAGTVQMPYGGKNQLSESECSIHKLPLLKGTTDTASFMSCGFNPRLSSWSPFHGAAWAVTESLARLVAAGGKWRETRFSFQEYFRRLEDKPENWGLPFAALLGALKIQRDLELPAIGGKDSMSGSFGELHVPPTLISFAVTTGKASGSVSTDFKGAGHRLYLLRNCPDGDHMPRTEEMALLFDRMESWIGEGKILSAQSLKAGGAAEALFKGAVGNGIGVEVQGLSSEELYELSYGSFLLETEGELTLEGTGLAADRLREIGVTTDRSRISATCDGQTLFDLPLEQCRETWSGVFQHVFEDLTADGGETLPVRDYREGPTVVLKNPLSEKSRPRVLIPAFPGTNCEYDTLRAFEQAGAEGEILLFRNRNAEQIEESLERLVKELDRSQLLMLSGGFSAGDEPEGSGKFIANILSNSAVRDGIHRLLDRDGLILGICNGFQALVKSGLLPHGRITAQEEHSPTLTYNNIGRHISRIASLRVTSNLSPWLSKMNVGDIHQVAFSHGEGKFYADPEVMEELFRQGQVCFQYADGEGNPTMDRQFNPNGSVLAAEGICSPDGRILGKMGHSERYGENLFRNIPGEKHQPLFEGGVEYFR